MDLPQAFLARMQAMLPAEYDAFLHCMAQKPRRGLRCNTLKCNEPVLRSSLPFSITPVPFSPNGFSIESDEKLGGLPAFHAGMFYAQEPSAMAPVTLLDPKPGDRVLDLCAAPGGKSTQIAAALKGQGLLWANEVMPDRAGILRSNVERMGVSNAVVSCMQPRPLCEKLAGFFDKVLVDAPCSGEGMFRKEAAAVAGWSVPAVQACATRQGLILDDAAKAVKEGGILMYATCTFSPEENEDVVTDFLQRHPDFELLPIDAPFGRPAYGIPARRIFPMDGGAGHFMAKLRRLSPNPCRVRSGKPSKLGAAERQGAGLLQDLFLAPPAGFLQSFGDHLALLPEGLPRLTDLRILSAGVRVGTCRKGRVEPAHALFLAASAQACRQCLSFAPDDPQLLSYLRGMEIPAQGTGYTAVAVNDVIIGFGKASGGVLKNRYPKGLRLRS